MEEKMDLRIRKTYLALHNAFTQLLEEKKFEDFTVNELCDRAMIRRTTFYKHFADKYEYYTFYMKEIVATFQDRLAPDIPDGDVRAYLLHMSRELLRFMKQHEKLVQNVKSSSMFPMLLSILLDQIQEDVLQVMKRANAIHRQDVAKMVGIAAFYAGGLANALFHIFKYGNDIEEEMFIEVVSEFIISNKSTN